MSLTTPPSIFVVGERFSSLAALEAKLEQAQHENSMQLWKRDSRTIAAAVKKGIKRPMKEELGVYSMKICCCHGGKKFKSGGTGQRKSKTLKNDCPYSVNIMVSADGNNLEVTDIVDEHNHEIHPSLFAHYARQRKLSEEKKAEVRNLLSLDCNKKVLQQKLMVETNQVILLKDIHNIGTASKKGMTRNDLTEFVRILREEHKCDVGICVGEGNALKGIVFQDEAMKKVFDAYPEIVCIDATYKLTELRIPVYITLAEDGMGMSEITAISLLISEEAETLHWLLEWFKSNNPGWSRTRVFMADKDMTERHVICLLYTSPSPRDS